jgi:hypothetical protein
LQPGFLKTRSLKMSLINIISVPTSSGIKTIEIHNDDITNLDWEVDVLVFSAYHYKYNPAPNTVIEALQKNRNIVIEDYAKSPLLDLRDSLHSWVSVETGVKSIRYLLCIEGIKTDIQNTGNCETSLSNVFGVLSILPHKGINANTVALPILGTGYQGNNIEVVLPSLIEKAIYALNSISSLNTIYFVDIDGSRSELIDKVVNENLKRNQDVLEMVFENDLLTPLFDRIKQKLLQMKSGNQRFRNSSVIDNLVSKILQKDLKFYELGILSRKLLEMIVQDLLPENRSKGKTLNESINELSGLHVAPWMTSYIHIIRVFGNSVAHYTEDGYFPETMDRTDMLVFVHSLDKLLDFHAKFPAFMKGNRRW